MMLFHIFLIQNFDSLNHPRLVWLVTGTNEKKNEILEEF